MRRALSCGRSRSRRPILDYQNFEIIKAIRSAKKVEVRTVFFVPKDGKGPTADQSRRLGEHLGICQKRYEAMLGGRDTFKVADGPAKVHKSNLNLAELKALPENAAGNLA